MFCYILDTKPYMLVSVVNMPYCIPELVLVVMDIQIIQNAGRCIM